ncbi:MAG: hypothetical protein ACO1OX_01310 [Novosphingobium sp.]
MIGAALLLLASAPADGGIATFRCTFDDMPANLASLPAPERAAWEATKGASAFDVSFPIAQPEDIQKTELFGYRGDDLTGYAVETGLPGPLKSANGPTEARRPFYPASLRQTLENGPDHWLWVELTSIDLENGIARLNLYRQERPALIRPTWRISGSCADANRASRQEDQSPEDESEVDFGQ